MDFKLAHYPIVSRQQNLDRGLSGVTALITTVLIWVAYFGDNNQCSARRLTAIVSVAATIFQEAQQRGVLCNVVRDRSYCDFYYPAVVRRGPLQIAISTAGHSGALAHRLRQELEYQFGPEWEDLLRWLGEARSSLYNDPLSPRQRRTLLHKLASRKTQEEMFRRWGLLPKRKR
jgi:hypothetical protein